MRNAFMRCVALFALVLGLQPASGYAEEPATAALDNWQQWRGPLVTGFAPHGDPPLRWDATTNIKWKAPLPGRGSATPIVWNDRVFVLTAIDTGEVADPKDRPQADPSFQRKTQPPQTWHEFVVLCFDRQTGALRWRQLATRQVPHEGTHPTHTYAAGSPTTDGRFLYASFGSRGLYCYDVDGKLRWQRDLGRMNSRLGWGEAVTPVLHGDTLFINWDQEKGSLLYALDARTGQDRWKVERDERTTWSTPLVVAAAGRTQVVMNGTNRVRSYDAATGKPLWQCGGQTVNPIPSPVPWRDCVICMSGYQGAAAFALPLDAAGDITDTKQVLWHTDKGTPYVPSPLLVGDRLYFTQRNEPMMTCLDVATGKTLIDRERLPGAKDFYASPVCAGERIYFTDRDGTTVVIKRSDKLEALATNRLGDPIDASPAVVGKQIFLRGEKYLYCIEGN
jgi:outer membrane protein assembly factor BamB